MYFKQGRCYQFYKILAYYKAVILQALVLIYFKVSLSDKVGLCVWKQTRENSANSVTLKRNLRRWDE